jgi:GNAT superfamily N-acetyltransferase
MSYERCGAIYYRLAVREDVPQMARIWGEEGAEGGSSGDRMAAYFEGRHNPQQALPTRVMYVALEGDTVIAYVAGHLTRRYACQGELQWIYVAPAYRCRGVAFELLRLMSAWFADHQSFRVCVNVDPGNITARAFYTNSGAMVLNPHWLVWDRIDKLKSVRGNAADGLE